MQNIQSVGKTTQRKAALNKLMTTIERAENIFEIAIYVKEAKSFVRKLLLQTVAQSTLAKLFVF